MTKSIHCLGWLAFFLATGCQNSVSSSSAVTERLTPDSISSLLPKPGTELQFDVTITEIANGQTEVKTEKQFWKWEKSGDSLVLTKSDSSGRKVREQYSTEWGICLDQVGSSVVEPCMPVIVDGEQKNPHGGFTGPREDGSVGSFSASHIYKGPELAPSCKSLGQSHIIESEQTFEKDGNTIKVAATTWWSKGLGIVKQIKTVTSKGLKRVTTLVLSPK